MRKILFICIVTLGLNKQTKGQLLDTPLSKHVYPVDANSLILKAKKQKTAAWILSGSGLLMDIVGLALIAGDIKKESENIIITSVSYGFANTQPYDNSKAGPILLLAGTGAILSSVPFFIASGKNKRRANVVLTTEKLYAVPHANEYHVRTGIKMKL